MPTERTLASRVSAIERRLNADNSPSNPAVERPTDHSEDALADRIESIESRLDDLEAGQQAIRGYIGNVEHVNQSVERRANAAIAAVERLEAAPIDPPPIATATHASGVAEQTETDPSDPTTDDSKTESESSGILHSLASVL